MNRLLMMLLSGLVFCLSLAAKAELVNETENLFVDRLEGAWIPDSQVNARLGDKKADDVGEISFKTDPSALKAAPIENEKVYTAGYVTYRTKRGPMTTGYALVIRSGNPTLLIQEKEGDKVTFERAYLSIVRATNPKDDILFIGGDHARESFMAMKRK